MAICDFMGNDMTNHGCVCIYMRSYHVCNELIETGVIF